jgi:hypothetical protein
MRSLLLSRSGPGIDLSLEALLAEDHMHGTIERHGPPDAPEGSRMRAMLQCTPTFNKNRPYCASG